MQKIWKILSSFIIVALAVPTGVFASVQNVQISGVPPAASEVQLVRVVALRTSQTVVREGSTASKVSACSLNGATSAYLLQNAEAVSLNQPASCFNLASARLAALPNLTVAPIRQFAKVVAPSPNRILEYPSLTPAPIAQGSALPGVVFVVFGLILLEEKKLIQKLATRLPEKTAKCLTLNRLVILRC